MFHRKLSYQKALVLLSLLPLISMLRPGTYESGDLTFQAYKLHSFYSNLAAGHWIPRWSAELNATYGYPNFIFTYHLPYYIASFFHALGFHLITSVTLTLALTYIFSGLFFYQWIKKHVSDKAAFLGSCLYLFAPYRFVTMHFRATLGESTAQMILPLCTWALYHFNSRKTYRAEIYVVISISLLILSHQAITLLGIPLLILYSLYLSKYHKSQSLVKTLRPFVSALLITTYYWLPILKESSYTLQYQFPVHIQHAQLWTFFFSPWKYGLLFQGPDGQLSPALGYIQWLVLLVGFISVLRVKTSSLLHYAIFIFCLYFFVAQEFSPTWYFFHILNKIQFSYRFVGILIFIASAIGALTLSLHESKPIVRKLALLIIPLLFVTTLLNWGNRKVIPYPPHKDFIAFAPFITEKGEGFDPAIPRWVDPTHPWKNEVPDTHVQGINNPIVIEMENREYTSHTYRINAPLPTRIIENTYFFPGWELYIDNNKTQIKVDSQNFPGLITFSVPPGKHLINLKFVNTPLRKFAGFVSIATAGLLILGVLRKDDSQL